MMRMDGGTKYQIIETLSQLEELVRELARHSVLAVDLEADSMYHYRERVCLIQMATPDVSAIIDPFRFDNLDPLIPIFEDPHTQKVFHGADYDVRCLHRDFGIRIQNLFDTQIASRFLGFPETGLDAVIKKEFNVDLDKRFQKRNWSERPLPPEMLDYAARDTLFLIPLARILQQKLQQKNRLPWVMEECDILSRVRHTPENGQALYLKFKGAGRLSPRQLAILENLLRLRQQLAEKKDRPPFKIFSNTDLIRIVQTVPTTLAALQKSRTLSERQISMHGEAVVAAVVQAINQPDDDLPVYPKKRSPVLSARVPNCVKALKTWRTQFAGDLEMDPSLIMIKSLMSSIAVRNPSELEELLEIEELRNWQREALGDAILQILETQSPEGRPKKNRGRRRHPRKQGPFTDISRTPSKVLSSDRG